MLTAMAGTICKRILVVEDHADSASTLATVLLRDGHDVCVARSVADARELCSNDSEFDVLLLDILLPDGSGLDLAPQLKQRFPNARIVAVTALGMANDLQAISDAGFDGHVLKPYRLEDLRLHLR